MQIRKNILSVCAILSLAFPLAAWAAPGAVNIYPAIKAPSFVYDSGEYALSANGKSVPVRAFNPHGDNPEGKRYYYAQLAVDGDVTFVVDAKEPVGDWSVSPKNDAVEGTVDGTRLTFTITKPLYLAVNINHKAVLYVLADPLEKNAPPATGLDPVTKKTIQNVANPPYRADRTGATPVTAILQSAIDKAAAAGGGIVYVPAGTYLSSQLVLGSNVRLYLAPGAALLADDQKPHWPQSESNTFIMASKVSNIRIYGRGVIACRGVFLNGGHDTALPGQFRIRPFHAEQVNGMTLEGITVNESTNWTIDIKDQTHSILIRNLKILNDKVFHWNDGIDITGSYDARVEHCFVATADDAACVKAIDFPVYNVVYNDMVMCSGVSSGFKVGMQAEADIHDVTLSNFNVLECNRGFDLSHWFGKGNWHDIKFEDWRVEQLNGAPGEAKRGKYFNTAFRMEIINGNDKKFDRGTGPISSIQVTRATFDPPSPTTPHLCGDSNSADIRNITFTDLTMNGKKVTAPGEDFTIKDYVKNIVVRTSSRP